MSVSPAPVVPAPAPAAVQPANPPAAPAAADPPGSLSLDATLPRLLDYLSTWSAVKRYQAEQKHDPLPALMAELLPAWGDSGMVRQLEWPLFLRVGTVR